MNQEIRARSEAFLLAAYNEKHSTLSKIRDRAYNTTRFVSLGYFAFGGFIYTELSGSLSEEQKAAALVAILLVLGLTFYLINQWYRTISTILAIVSNIEISMGFHEIGAYIHNRKLFPDDVASAEKFKAGEYDKSNKFGYRTVVIASSIFAAALVLLAA